MDSIEAVLQNYRLSSEPWALRNKKSKRFKKLKAKVINFLECLSGGHIKEMLIDVLDASIVHQIQTKYSVALQKISGHVNNKIKAKMKHNFIRPLREAKLTRDEARELGFKVGKKLWRSSISDHDRHLGGQPSLFSKDPQEVEAIKSHMENLSNPAASRSVYVKKYELRPPWVPFKKRKIHSRKTLPVMYRETTLTEAYKQYKQLKLSESVENRVPSFWTFKKYIDERFKKPRQKTDVCEYCEYGKLVFPKVLNFIKTYYEPIPDEILEFIGNNYGRLKIQIENYELLKQGLNRNSPDHQYQSVLKNYKENVSVLDEIHTHKSIANMQRVAYNEIRKNPDVLDGKLMIEIDYKQKIPLDKGPVQISSEFFTLKGDVKKRVVCLGFGIYFVNQITGKKVNFCWNLDVISDDLRADAYMLILMFRHVMELDIFKQIDRPNYVIWTDCGKQFRCKEFFHFLFVELASKGKSVELNFFGEKHGELY